jgi:hypothetical protein
MGFPAGLLNRKVSFLRRALMPAAPDQQRGGYGPIGASMWGGYRPKGPEEITIGGMQLQVSAGVLTVRDDAFTRGLTISDQVVIDGTPYEIYGQRPGERPDGVLRFDVRTAPSRALYAREFDARGEVVIVRRIVANAPAIDAYARARIVGYQPDELVGGIQQGERRVFLSAEDLEAAGWPVPPRVNDKIMIRGGTKQLNVLSVDDSTHRAAGELLVYELRVSG